MIIEDENGLEDSQTSTGVKMQGVPNDFDKYRAGIDTKENTRRGKCFTAAFTHSTSIFCK